MSYRCQLCGHDGPLSEPCPVCEANAERIAIDITDPENKGEGEGDLYYMTFAQREALNQTPGMIAATLHRLRATRAQLLDDANLRQVLAEKEARILSLEYSLDVSREQFQMANRERGQFRALSMRYASAKLPETIEAVRQAHMDAILAHDSSAEMTPADERCEVLLEALQVMAAEKNRAV